jgi:hypothetical protein
MQVMQMRVQVQVQDQVQVRVQVRVRARPGRFVEALGKKKSWAGAPSLGVFVFFLCAVV